MAEAVGAIGSALGILTFIRNATQTVLTDRNQWKQYATKLLPLMEDTELLRDRLQEWQAFWHVDDGTPTIVLEGYWGSEGARKIMQLRANLNERVCRLKNECERYFGDIPGGRKILRKSSHSALASIHVDLRERLDSFRHDTRVWDTFRAVLYRDKIFQENLKAVKESLTVLTERSEYLFRMEHRTMGRDDWRGTVDFVAANEHLTFLAQDSRIRALAKALHENLRLAKQADFDLYLDHNAYPDNRLKKLFSSAREGNIEHSVHMSPLNAADNVSAHLMCSGNAWQSVSSTSAGHQIESLDQMLNLQAVSATWSSYHLLTEGFILSFKSRRCDCIESESLRFLLSTQNGSQLRHKERTQLSYEVVENALIFFGTDWLNSLCSCGIQRCRDSSWETRYTARISKVQHLDPDTGVISEQFRPWCEKTFLKEPLRRLGFLLTEIALGRTLGDVYRNPDTRVVGIDLDVDVDNPENTVGFTDHGITIRISDRDTNVSEDLATVVWYCFHHDDQFPPGQIEHLDMDEFFNSIVLPLLLHYDKEIIQPYKDRNLRNREENRFWRLYQRGNSNSGE